MPVEPPKMNPCRASRWQARIVSASSTRIDLVDQRLIEHRGGTLVPSPGISRRLGGPPKVTDPTLSTAMIRTGQSQARR